MSSAAPEPAKITNPVRLDDLIDVIKKVHDEGVTDLPHGVAVSVLQHPGGVDRDMPLRIAEHGEDVGGRRGDEARYLDAVGHAPIVSRRGVICV